MPRPENAIAHLKKTKPKWKTKRLNQRPHQNSVSGPRGVVPGTTQTSANRTLTREWYMGVSDIHQTKGSMRDRGYFRSHLIIYKKRSSSKWTIERVWTSEPGLRCSQQWRRLGSTGSLPSPSVPSALLVLAVLQPSSLLLHIVNLVGLYFAHKAEIITVFCRYGARVLSNLCSSKWQSWHWDLKVPVWP